MQQDQLIGRTIGGRFRIESFLGEGAMGRVYRARQIALNTTVAVKVMHHNLACIPAVGARFLREAQAASRIDHPSSVRVIDFGQEPDGLLYLAMELIDGESLAEIMTETGPLPAPRIVDIASQVLAALAVAHELGVVHRDLKPENIMVLQGKDDDGHPHDVVKVCDFGIAKLVDEAGAAPTVTQEGTILGTPAYMSPEQARGEPLDGRSDIYAMGVLLFQMMTGEVPFDASSPFGTALMHVTDEPTKPRLLVPTVDARLEAICLKAMRKRPGERYASARELRSELRALLSDGEGRGLSSVAPTTLRAQVESSGGRSGRIVVGLALGGAALVGAFLFGAKAKPVAEEPHAAAQPVAVAPPAPKPVTPEERRLEVPPPVPEAEPAATVPHAERPAPAQTAASRSPSRRTPVARAVEAKATKVDKTAKTEPVDKTAKTDSTKPAAAKPTTTVSARTAEPPAPPTDEGLPVFVPRPAAPEQGAQPPAAAPAAPPAAAPAAPAAPSAAPAVPPVVPAAPPAEAPPQLPPS